MELDKKLRMEDYESRVNAEKANEEANKRQQFLEKIKTICENEEAIELLKLIYKASFYFPGSKELSVEQSLLFREGRRSVYLELREFIPKEVLVKLEIYN